MAIEISGVNNNDKITASDGVIDTFSGVSFASTISAPSFTGNLTGDVTGNLTGNVNQTSNLLLQIGGSEKIRISSSGQIGIGGANYGTAGQVLTSGGSGGAVSWSTINSDAINEGDTKAEVVDTGSDGHFKVITENTERLRVTSDGKVGFGTNPSVDFDIMRSGSQLSTQYKTTTNHAIYTYYDAARGGTDVLLAQHNYRRGGATVARQQVSTGNGDVGYFRFFTKPNGGSFAETLRINSDGAVTKPKNPAFKAQMTSSYNPGSTGWKTIPYNTDSQTGCFDVGDNFNTSTHRFTAPVDGYYFFGLNQRCDSGDSQYFRVAFGLDGDYNSGGDYPYGHAIYDDNDGFQYYSFSITSLNYMTAGQYMIAMGYSNTDTNFYWQNESIFYGFLLQ